MIDVTLTDQADHLSKIDNLYNKFSFHYFILYKIGKNRYTVSIFRDVF